MLIKYPVLLTGLIIFIAGCSFGSLKEPDRFEGMSGDILRVVLRVKSDNGFLLINNPVFEKEKIEKPARRRAIMLLTRYSTDQIPDSDSQEEINGFIDKNLSQGTTSAIECFGSNCAVFVDFQVNNILLTINQRKTR